MSNTTTQSRNEHATRTAWTGGVSLFAGTVLCTVGLFQFLEGLSAALEDELYVSTPDYVYQLDVTSWGWIHMALGIVAIAIGVGVMMDKFWALLLGVLIASISATSQFLFLPWQPLWAVLIIGIDVAVIWALTSRLADADAR